MEALAISVGVVVAVAGWIANGELARRETRRHIRVEYLLSAYRRLEAASNRAMTGDHEAAIESAVSDIQLLGSNREVELADEFANQFAASGHADTAPLLEELRRSLRDVLDLRAVPPRRVWLRITSAGLWAETESLVRARVLVPPDQRPEPTPSLPERQHDPADQEMAVAAAFAEVEAELRMRVEANGTLAPDELPEAAALAHNLITKETSEAVEGLRIMRNLAGRGTKRVTRAEEEDFKALAEGVIYAVRHPRLGV